MKNISFVAAFMASLSALPMPANAQTANQIKERLLEERREEANKQRASAEAPGLEIGTPEQIKDADQGNCFAVHDIKIEGVTKLPPEDLQKIIEPYANSCMGQLSVDSVLQLISQAYLDGGWITSRAYLPEQDLSTGVLHIVVVEGIIEGIEYTEQRDDVVKQGSKTKIKTAFPTKKGKILNLRDLEQGIDNLNRISSAHGTLDIAPGEGVGGSIIKIANKIEDQTRLKIKYNYVADDNGIYRAVDLNFEQDNLFGLNDSLFLGYSGGTSSNALSASFAVPYGYWYSTISANYSESSSLLTPTSELFEQTVSLENNLRRLVFRDAKSKKYLEGKVGYSLNERFINGSALTPQELVYFRVGVSAEHYGEGTFFGWGAGVNYGLLTSDFDAASVGAGPDDRFHYFDLNLQMQKRFANNSSLYTTINGQYSNEPLYSNNQLSLGGRTGLKGISARTVSGERGFTLYSEYNFAPHSNLQCCKSKSSIGKKLEGAIKTTRPYAYLNGGIIDNIANDQIDYGMAIGLGFKTYFDHHLLETFIGIPVINSTNLQDSGFTAGFKLTAKVF